MHSSIDTKRLLLRPLDPNDASQVEQLLSEKSIAANTRSIPYPYPKGGATPWIAEQLEAITNGTAFVAAVVLNEDLIGCVGLAICHENQNAELGYWIGKPYWGKGFCTEAVSAVLNYGFESLGLHRIHAHHLKRNPASGRVLQKCGMREEGMLRQHHRKWGIFEDIVLYGRLASDHPHP